MRILVIDIGGTNVKVAGSWDRELLKVASGPTMTAGQMAERVLAATKDWEYDVVSIGYPGPVKANQPVKEPRNIGGGWKAFDFEAAFGKPVRVVNDAALQALGSYAGGRMLFMGLGTGLGTAIVSDGRLEPLEIAHLPYKKEQTFEEYLGEAGLERLGKERWIRNVGMVAEMLRNALLCDYVMLGGGNVRKIDTLPPHTRRGGNEYAIDGGIRLWAADTIPTAVPHDAEPDDFN